MLPITHSTKAFLQELRDAVSTSSIPMLLTHPGTRSYKYYPIAQKILRYRIPLEDFDDLLAGPLSGRMFCDIEVHINAAMMGEDHLDEQHLESLGWHNEVIDQHHVPHIGVQKILPRRRGYELATPFGIGVLKDAGSIPSLESR